jgi:hypothetical protein
MNNAIHIKEINNKPSTHIWSFVSAFKMNSNSIVNFESKLNSNKKIRDMER